MTKKSSLSDWRLAGIRTAAELNAGGKSSARIASLTRRGTLIQVRRGVYARADMARQVQSHPYGAQLLAAAAELLGVGPGSVGSHETAARIHGIDLLAGADRELIDLARTLQFRAGVVAADSALHLKLATKAELESVLAHCSRWPGATRAAAVIAFADGLSESVLESLARVVFRDCGLPPPELQVWVGGAEVAGRVDFLFRRFRTVAEVDGRMKYGDPSRAVKQLERDRQLRDAGYEVAHFSWQHINENPGYVNTVLRDAFRRGERPTPGAAAGGRPARAS